MTKGRKDKYTAQEVIDAIAGTGGIVTAVARRLGCTWDTVHRYIENYPTIKAAYDAEVDSTLDIAESVLLDNIRIARRFQTENKTVVDTSDSKWYLTKKGKRRGYGDAVEVGGTDGGPVELRVVYENKRQPQSDDPPA
jgi:hypothetical protein